MNKRAKLTFAALALASSLALTGCMDYDEGPAGKVVDNDRTYRGKTLGWKYELVTEKNGKRSSEFRVSSNDYYDCPKGAKYPKCTKKSD
jgi:hypothetical protein